MKLTNKEIEILKMIKDDRDVSNEELAEILDIKTKSVKFHLTNIYKKLGAKRRRDLVAIINSNLFSWSSFKP